MMFKNPELKNIFEQAPMSSLRQGPNLRKFLCKSKLPKVQRNNSHQRSTHSSAPGWRKCSKPCPACPFALPPSKTVKGQASSYEHTITSPVTCQTTNAIYYWKCIKDNCPDFPGCEYIGMTSRTFQKRFYEHQYYIKSENVFQPSGEHFHKPGHSLHDMRGLVLEKVRNPDPFVLKARETLLIQKFKTFSHGLNKEP